MEREALHSAAVKFSLDLHPSATGDVMEGVRDQLNTALLRPSVHLDGVLVSYTNPCILSKQARIHPYFPYFHVDVSADCVLFKPAVGQILDGKVHMVSHDFIGLLILGLFNVSIGRQQIRADLNYDVMEDCWKSQRHAEHRIARDTPLRFRVEKIDDESEFFTLAGSLLAAGTGNITFLTQQSNKKRKKRRHSEAVGTDATPTSDANAATPPVAASDGLSAKARKKAAKQARRSAAAASGSAEAAPLAGPPQEQAQAAMAPPSTARPLHNQDAAGGDTDSLAPKRKKRRKHREQSSELPVSDATAGQPLVNMQSHADQSGSAPAHGDLQGHHNVAPALRPASDVVEQSPADVPIVQKLAGSETDVPQAKQKSHKKKNREIDKLVMPAVTPSGHSDLVSQQLAQTVDAATNGVTGKKKRKKHRNSAGHAQS
ncbi:hypothetical protein ABBQ38_004888 [Trebouxia sp. C0009 RCD-2024]